MLLLLFFFTFSLLFVWMPSPLTLQPGGSELPLGAENTINRAQKKGGNQTHTELNTKPYMENLSHQVIHFFTFFFLLSNIFSWSITTFNKLNKQTKTTRVSLLSPTFYWSLSLCCLCQNHNEPWKTTRCCWFVKTFVIGFVEKRKQTKQKKPNPASPAHRHGTITWITKRVSLPREKNRKGRRGGKKVQFQLYQWQASGTEHTDKQAKR